MSCVPNNTPAEPCCTDDIYLWLSNLGFGHGWKMNFQGLMNSVPIPSFMISLILLVAVTEERDRRCAFFIVKKRTAILNLCSHHTTPNAVLLSLLNLWEKAHCVSFKSRYTTLDSVVIWETKSTTSLRQTWRKMKLEFLRQQHFPFLCFLPLAGMSLLVSCSFQGLTCYLRTVLFWKLRLRFWTFLAPSLLSWVLASVRFQSLTVISLILHKCIADSLLMMMD